jgi:hypothetical protein
VHVAVCKGAVAGKLLCNVIQWKLESLMEHLTPDQLKVRDFLRRWHDRAHMEETDVVYDTQIQTDAARIEEMLSDVLKANDVQEVMVILNKESLLSVKTLRLIEKEEQLVQYGIAKAGHRIAVAQVAKELRDPSDEKCGCSIKELVVCI